MNQHFPATIDDCTVISMIRIPTSGIEVPDVWLVLLQDGTGEHGEPDTYIIWEVRKDTTGAYRHFDGDYDIDSLTEATRRLLTRATADIR